MIRILAVDDDRDLVKFLMRILQAQGWEAGAAYDGEEAMLQVKQGRWDAVLLDIKMPKLDGLAALKQMRQYDPNLPVVLITGDAERGDMMEAYRSGADACLVKPLDDQDLVKAIREALERSQASRSRATQSPSEVRRVRANSKKKTKPLK
jgi:DNA-binding response OmpR family regulator